MKQIKVTLKTITPLWTGDAWQENTKIRPSSLMGSLRFWFEVICYFTGITSNNNYENGKLKDEVNGDDFKKKIIHNGADFYAIDKTLAEMGVSLPSRIFGCTSWKGWIRIKEIKPIENGDYNYPTGKTQFEELKYIKEYFNKKTNKKEKKEIIPAWYFNKGFYGQFELTFEIEENIIEPIFYPLLTFMDRYGFWGGKWNIGYGRLKTEKVKMRRNNNFEEVTSWKKEEFVFSKFCKDNNSRFENKNFSDFIQAVSNFSDLKSKMKKILYKLENQITNNNFSSIIEGLIKRKATHRRDISNSDERHNVFGTTSGGAQGTKIIPWIREEDGSLIAGFVSIAGILNIKGKERT